MEYTEIVPEKNGRKLSVTTRDWDNRECDEMQLTVMQHDSYAFMDLSKKEAKALRDKINEWIEE